MYFKLLAMATTMAVARGALVQIGPKVVGPALPCNDSLNPFCGWSVTLTPDAKFLVMGTYNQQAHLTGGGAPDPLPPSTRMFRQKGNRYEPFSSKFLPVGSPSISGNGTFAATKSYVNLQSLSWCKTLLYYTDGLGFVSSQGSEGYSSLSGGVSRFYQWPSGVEDHQLDIYSKSGDKISDGGILSADGSLLVTTTKWAAYTPPSDDAPYWLSTSFPLSSLFISNPLIHQYIGSYGWVWASSQPYATVVASSSTLQTQQVGLFHYDGYAYRQVSHIECAWRCYPPKRGTRFLSSLKQAKTRTHSDLSLPLPFSCMYMSVYITTTGWERPHPGPQMPGQFHTMEDVCGCHLPQYWPMRLPCKSRGG